MTHLLIVDDDSDTLEALSDVLRAEGHHIQTAANGEEALDPSRLSADLMLLDVDMPVMDGPDMAHEMKLHELGEEKIPVLLCSARADLPRLAAKMGTPYVLEKPFALEALFDTLTRALRDRIAPSSA